MIINRKHSYKTTKGFTLVELSIVIVIIGLIVAGVTAGQSIIRQAKLNRIITDVSKYKVAINSFRLQYNYFPGDMPNAKSYWSSCTDSGGNTCNGNGDKLISVYPEFENLRFWQHLALAGLIEGSYSGLTYGAGLLNDYPGYAAPAGPFSQSVYSAFVTDVSVYGRMANSISLDGATYLCNDYANGPVISGAEAYSIDKKIDDGVADKGIVFAAKGHLAACAQNSGCVANNNDAASSGAWDFSADTPQCRMFFYF